MENDLDELVHHARMAGIYKGQMRYLDAQEQVETKGLILIHESELLAIKERILQSDCDCNGANRDHCPNCAKVQSDIPF